MKTRVACILAAAGCLISIVLRCVQMLFYMDYETGFSTDDGFFTLLYCVLTLVSSLEAVVLIALDKSRLGVLQRRTSIPQGAVLLVTSAALIVAGKNMLLDYTGWKAGQAPRHLPAAHVEMYFPFAVLTLVFAAVCAVMALLWILGKGFPGSSGALWAFATVWGLCYIVITFITSSAVATMAENLFTIGGGAMMTLFLLYEGKTVSGMTEGRPAKWALLFGVPAVHLWLVYLVPNIFLYMAGQRYTSEMPMVLQVVLLMLTIHAVVFLLRLRRQNLKSPQVPVVPAQKMDSNTAESECTP